MIPDEPNSKEALAVYAGVTALARLHMIKKAARDAERGFVTWDASPPAHVYWETHKLSWLEAIHTGFSFCDTRLADEWVVVGRGLLAIVRTLPMFVEQVGASDETAMFIGRIRNIVVVYDWSMAASGFVMGIGSLAAKGSVLNLPNNFTDDDPVQQVQQIEHLAQQPPMWRAFQAVPDPPEPDDDYDPAFPEIPL